MRIVFMGTPQFALPSLSLLLSSRHQIAGVVTQPDRPKGRGLKHLPTPVKEFADRAGLPVLQPENLLDPGFIESLTIWNCPLFVVVGFRILPPEIFRLPEKGTINLHASLLPKYRGAAPIQWALIQGERETGVSTFLIDRNVDTGKILMQIRIPIGEKENAGELHDRLSVAGADLLLRTVDAIENGTAMPRNQEGTGCRAPKITLEDCRIDWNQSSRAITNRIRGLAPKPGAFSEWNGKRLKLIRAEVLSESEEADAGLIVHVSKQGIDVQTGSGILRIHEVQLEGKRVMKTDDFLRGHEITAGMRLS